MVSPNNIPPAGLLSRSSEEIARILTSLQAKAEPITASVGKEDRQFRSQLLFIDPDRHYIVVAGPENEASKAAVLSRSRLDFVAQFGGWHIEFAAADPQTTTLAGKAAVRLRFPEAVIRHQRRAEERIAGPTVRSLRCTLDAEGFAPFEGQIVDIAKGGIGILVYSSEITLEPGTILKGSRVERSAEEPVVVDLEVRYSTPVVLPDGTHAHRSGCVFLNPTREVMELIESFLPSAR